MFNMTHILKTDLDIFYILTYYQQNHLCLKDNISNSSTPGFKAMKLQDHLHHTDFKNESLQQKNINSSTKTMVDVEENGNGSNVG